MPEATNLQTSFLGGEISQSFQGRYDRPDYKISLTTCLNWFPIETGALVRRGGTQFLGATRGGTPGRIIPFDVAGANPIFMEFTDNHLRFWLGPHLITTNNGDPIVSISSATPAVVQTIADNGFQTGDQAYLNQFTGTQAAVLQNRVFSLTRVDGTHYSIADAITGAAVNGSLLGAVSSGVVQRVLDIATNYGSQSWKSIIPVQAETQSVLLNGSKPQVVTLTAPPSSIGDPAFSFAPASFVDGPYNDPFAGSIVNSNALSGNITLTFSFQAYSATVSYSKGDFVTSGGNGYQSLSDANLNNTPPNATFWLPVNAGAPVGPNGFTSSDIGRHIRLFSEPAAWNSGTGYVSTTPATIVKYNGSYWAALANSTGVTPGTSATDWGIVSGAAYATWTWGKVLTVSSSGLINPVTAIGNYTALAAAFDGTTSKTSSASANASATANTFPVWQTNTGYSAGTGVYYNGNLYTANTTFTIWQSGVGYNHGQVVLFNDGNYYVSLANSNFNTPGQAGWASEGIGNPTNTNVWNNNGPASSVSLDEYAGQDFHTSAKTIASVTIFPSTDLGYGVNLPAGGVTFNLRASHTAPLSASNGTLLGTTGGISNSFASISINSINTATAWEYFWVEMVATQLPPLPDNGSHTFTMSAFLAQAQFYSPNSNNGSVITLQLVGNALLNTGPINTWRLGLYSDTSGWPTCGTYSEGRLWLGGVVDNRFDASNSNQLFNFAPTGPDGTVADNNAISYTLNAPDVNAILWMLPDLQGVLMGTQKREWLIQPASTASGISPTNIVGTPATHLGCAKVEPRRTEHTIVFVQKHQRKILELFADVFSGKFSAPNLLDKARHLTATNIQEIAYQQELTPTIWARCGNGSLFGVTYKRDTLMTSQGPTFYAPHRHTLGSGRLVESIAVGPSPDGTLDSLALVTNDPITGVRHVELMNQYFEETNLLQNAWLLDDAIVPTSFSISNSSPAPYGGVTLNGFTYLNGKTVTVFAGGLDCGDFTVSTGSVVVPFGDGISAGTANGLFTAAFVNSFVPTIPIVVGFTFNSDGQRVRPMEPPETGARNGPALGKLRRNEKYAFQVVNTTGLSVGTAFTNLDPVNAEMPAAEKVPVGQLFSGVIREALDDIYNFDGQICWRVSRPWPAMITAVAGFLETQDE